MSHKPLVPEAEAKLDKIKNGFINEFGAEIDKQYKGDISSKKIGFMNGPVGGEMTKMMVEDFEKRLAKRRN